MFSQLDYFLKISFRLNVSAMDSRETGTLASEILLGWEMSNEHGIIYSVDMDFTQRY